MGKVKKMALIWWINTEFSDIVPFNTVPKEDQCVNCITTLLWRDGKKVTKHNAKIIAVSG